MAIHRDTIVAILLLAFTALMWNATYDIEITPYSSMASNVWPRIILMALGLFSALLLAQSVVKPDPVPEAGPGSFLRRYRNALVVYALFLGFLLTLPYLGMLIGATAFVFLALTLLGEPGLKPVGKHVAISLVAVGAMWSIFTFVLRVRLPEGEILTIY